MADLVVTASQRNPARAARAEDSSALDLRDLTKAFGPVAAVRGIDLRVAPGEIVAVLGPNGAGKSTTNEMILGITKPDHGRVAVFGQDPLAAVRSGKVGAMLQAGALLADARVIDLLRLMRGLHAHPLSIEEVVARADLAGFLKTKTDKLSGGQAQRVRYALALMPDPDLLILDEPTVGMDVELRRTFWTSMRNFAGAGRTVLFATHYLEEADQVADRIVVLASGRIVADGTGAQIRAHAAGRTIAIADDGPNAAMLATLPGVSRVEARGARLRTTDSDRTLRALLDAHPGVHDIEITSANLEDAFLALTSREPS
jgi:ABC-2 type transport system ATP-binding protein